jgi:broad specificity phosphatase PhoE
MQELSERMRAALSSCLELPPGSRPLLVSHGMALGCLFFAKRVDMALLQHPHIQLAQARIGNDAATAGFDSRPVR